MMPANFIYATLRNADAAQVSRGMVVRISANSRFVRAQADSVPNLAGLYGVVGSGVVGVGGIAVVISHAASEPVLLETGLTVAAGDALYVSASVAGRATNVAPGNAAAIGTVLNVSLYTRNATVQAEIGVGLSL